MNPPAVGVIVFLTVLALTRNLKIAIIVAIVHLIAHAIKFPAKKNMPDYLNA
jgi:ABC-type lipoprotein release transport system permease subunit